MNMVAAFAGLGVTSQELQGIPLWPLFVWGMWTFERYWEILQHKPKQAAPVEEQLEEALAK